VVLVVSRPHENQYNDRLKSTAKGLEQYGSCRILSGSTPAARPEVTVLETVEGFVLTRIRGS
jgi:hypothetical protein